MKHLLLFIAFWAALFASCNAQTLEFTLYTDQGGVYTPYASWSGPASVFSDGENCKHAVVQFQLVGFKLDLPTSVSMCGYDVYLSNVDESTDFDMATYSQYYAEDGTFAYQCKESSARLVLHVY